MEEAESQKIAARLVDRDCEATNPLKCQKSEDCSVYPKTGLFRMKEPRQETSKLLDRKG
jgi:hypothetical protein